MSDPHHHHPEDPLHSSVDAIKAGSEATQTEREKVERAVDLLRAPEITHVAYQSLLEMMLDFYEPAEKRLKQKLPPELQKKLHLDQRQKTPWIKADLKTLGSNKTRASNRGVMRAITTFFAGKFRLLGLMYVMECVTLSSQAVVRNLAKALPQSATGATKFYRSYGAEVGTQWKSFVRGLRETLHKPRQIGYFSSAAKRAFSLLSDCLTRRAGTTKKSE